MRISSWLTSCACSTSVAECCRTASITAMAAARREGDCDLAATWWVGGWVEVGESWELARPWEFGQARRHPHLRPLWQAPLGGRQPRAANRCIWRDRVLPARPRTSSGYMSACGWWRPMRTSSEWMRRRTGRLLVWIRAMSCGVGAGCGRGGQAKSVVCTEKHGPQQSMPEKQSVAVRGGVQV